MICPEDYHIEIGWDEAGALVVVRHKPTGLERRARPTSTPSVGAVKSRLILQIQAEFCDEKEFRFDVGHGRVDGVSRDFYRVIHLPSGISRMGWRFEGATLRGVLDEVLIEVWRRKNQETAS